MTNLAKALYTFWSGFGIDAYPENDVPDNAELPYITYSVLAPDWRSTSVINARVWYRGSSLAPISAKVDEISRTIGEGISIPMTDGAIYLFKDDNFLQYQPTTEDMEVKIAYLSLVMHALM